MTSAQSMRDIKPPTSAAAPSPAHPFSRGPVRWLLFTVVFVASLLGLSIAGRRTGTLLLAALILTALGYAAHEARLLPRLRQYLHMHPRQRTLFYASVFVGLVTGLIALPHTYALAMLGFLLLGWLILIAYTLHQRGILRRISIRTLLERYWWLRWGSFGLVCLIIYALIISLQPPYNTVALVTLVIGGLPAAWTHSRDKTQSPVMLMQMLALQAVTMSIAATLAFITPGQVHFPDTWKLLVLGAMALSAAVYFSDTVPLRLPQIPPLARDTLNDAPALRRHHYMTGAGVLLLALVTEANGRWLNFLPLVYMSSHLQLVLLLMALVLIIGGLGHVGSVPWRQRLDRPLLIITVLALVVRFWQVDYALRRYVDELNFSAVVQEFWHSPNIPLLQPMSGIAAFPYIFPYFQSLSVEIFGRNLTGIRVPSIIIGTLTVIAVYMAARYLFDRRTGLMAALLLATFPPHLHFSRIGINNIADPLFGTLAFAFVARGLRQQRRMDYVIGGIMLGLTHYFYEGGRIVFIITMAAWLVGLMILWRPNLPWRRLLLVLGAAVLVALPIYYTLTAIDASYAARLEKNHTALDRVYWRNLFDTGDFMPHIRMRVLQPFLLYVQASDGSFFYGGNFAYILPLIVPGFLLGLGHTLARLRRPGPLLLLIWWLAVTLGNSIMVSADHSPRYVTVFPALAILIAVGIRYTLPLLLPHLPSARRWAMLAIVISFSLFQTVYYFRDHLPTFNHQLRAYDRWPDPEDAILRSINFPEDTNLHMVSITPPDYGFNHGVLAFMREDMKLSTIKPSELTLEYLRQLDPRVDHAFFLAPDQTNLAQMLRNYMVILPPQTSPYPDIPDYKQFTLYYSPSLPGFSERLLYESPRWRMMGRYPQRIP